MSALVMSVKKLHRFVPILRNAVKNMSSSLEGEPPQRHGHESSVLINNFQYSSVSSPDTSSILSSVREVDGRKIHYEVTGSGKKVILLLPGAIGSTRTDFGPQLENFNKDIFKLVAWDPPGYGKSYPPEREWKSMFLHQDAKLAAKLMQDLDIQKYSVLGWSDGGITGLVLAAMFPDRVQKLVVWGANAYITKEEAETYTHIRDIDNWSKRMREPFLELYGEEYFRKVWAGWVDNFVQHYYKDNNGDICKDDLSKISSPTLIIHGQKDPMVGQFHPDYLLNNIKGARLINMPEGKHNLHLRYYKEFNSMVESFLIEL